MVNDGYNVELLVHVHGGLTGIGSRSGPGGPGGPIICSGNEKRKSFINVRQSK